MALGGISFSTLSKERLSALKVARSRFSAVKRGASPSLAGKCKELFCEADGAADCGLSASYESSCLQIC